MHPIAIPHVLLIVLLSQPVETRGPTFATAPTVDTSLRFANLEDCSQASRKIADALRAGGTRAVVECIPLKLDSGPLNRPRR